MLEDFRANVLNMAFSHEVHTHKSTRIQHFVYALCANEIKPMKNAPRRTERNSSF